MNATPTKLVMYRRVPAAPQLSVVYEGEVPVADQADLKQLLGDGMAKVTASKELAKKDYGAGGSVYVSVTLTCDQSMHAIESTAGWARHLATKYCTEEYANLEAQLHQLGII